MEELGTIIFLVALLIIGFSLGSCTEKEVMLQQCTKHQTYNIDQRRITCSVEK